ncbi:hypothetical protein H310_04470 [Aphanomyces invadans]|uniref:Anaphase-promoting complex subunit 4 WD40 domain-containing protein n=1 Tax=Aphanomyces invadans TaxID=157072 RepID=A0A024UD24_9STRA|nr:hypothetical protein H310_04470 [Aphanomyces invadans]ETW04110.1 hypothetical protein H310_04470 [Aphanomyces invadans]|eukprot:XP_008867066.1 hypothetical protein H310_04470 [Aphanomyces invadans]
MAAVQRSSAYAHVLRRSLGEVSPREYIEDVYAEGSRQLKVNQKKVIHRQGMNVWHMDLDPVENQYLLVGAGTGALRIFDLSIFDTIPLPEDSSSIKPMCTVKPLKRPRDVRTFDAAQTQNLPGHAAGITAVQWYPVDNGMFITGSQDTTVKLWDANEMDVASAFCLHDVVHAACFSPCGSTLLAVGTDHADVRLCDVAIGASTHRLLGHRAAVRCIAWSLSDEFHLATGAADGSIRLWDIRRSGASACLMVLNQDGLPDIPRHEAAVRVPKRPRHNDPHHCSAENHGTSAQAHTQAIQSLRYTPDGRCLVSSGGDNCMRLWNASTGVHLFHNYGLIQCKGPRPVTIGLVQEGGSDSTMVYHPVGSNGSVVSHLLHGVNHSTPCTKLTAHYSRVTSCIYRPTTRELITGGEDGLIMLWTPPDIKVDPRHGRHDHEESLPSPRSTTAAQDEDAWSDDDRAADGGGDVFVPPILQRSDTDGGFASAGEFRI